MAQAFLDKWGNRQCIDNGWFECCIDIDSSFPLDLFEQSLNILEVIDKCFHFFNFGVKSVLHLPVVVSFLVEDRRSDIIFITIKVIIFVT